MVRQFRIVGKPSGIYRRPRKETTQRQIRDLPLSEPTAEPYTMFLTGGIGDFLALEYFMSPADRELVTGIYYATPQAEPIEEIVEALKFPNLVKQRRVWSDWSQFYCHFSKQQYLNRCDQYGYVVPDDIDKARDWSISGAFPSIRRGGRSGGYSMLRRTKLASIERFELPANFVAVVPYSANKHSPDRDFDARDWAAVIGYLKSLGRVGVVLHKGSEKSPKSDRLIDLTNKSSICESIEIVKASQRYFGVDSCLSVVAARHLGSRNMAIRSRSGFLYKWRSIYYPNHNEFTFISDQVANLVTRMVSENDIRFRKSFEAVSDSSRDRKSIISEERAAQHKRFLRGGRRRLAGG